MHRVALGLGLLMIGRKCGVPDVGGFVEKVAALLVRRTSVVI